MSVTNPNSNGSMPARFFDELSQLLEIERWEIKRTKEQIKELDSRIKDLEKELSEEKSSWPKEKKEMHSYPRWFFFLDPVKYRWRRKNGELLACELEKRELQDEIERLQPNTVKKYQSFDIHTGQNENNSNRLVIYNPALSRKYEDFDIYTIIKDEGFYTLSIMLKLLVNRLQIIKSIQAAGRNLMAGVMPKLGDYSCKTYSRPTATLNYLGHFNQDKKIVQRRDPVDLSRESIFGGIGKNSITGVMKKSGDYSCKIYSRLTAGLNDLGCFTQAATFLKHQDLVGLSRESVANGKMTNRSLDITISFMDGQQSKNLWFNPVYLHLVSGLSHGLKNLI